MPLIKQKNMCALVSIVSLSHALNCSAAAPIGESISLQASGTNRLVSADSSINSTNYPLYANHRSDATDTEKFTVIDAGNGRVGFLSEANGKYVCADRNLDSSHWVLAANRTNLGRWEKFTWVDNSDGTVSLLSQGSGEYVAASRWMDKTNWTIAATKATIAKRSMFNLISHSSSATPNTPNTPTTPTGLDKNVDPSGNFELIDWMLTLPTGGEVKEGSLTNYSSEYFYTDSSTGGMVFKCPASGDDLATTPTSKYYRAELREMLRAGNTSHDTKGIGKNNWVLSTASSDDKEDAGGVDGTLTATLRVDRVSTTGDSDHKGRVIVGQIHGEDDEPCRLYYRKLPNNDKGSIYFASEIYGGDDVWYEMIGSRDDDASNPSDGIALGEAFSYSISTIGRQLTVTISRDGKPDVTKEVTMSSGYQSDYLYFKAGLYNQNNSGDKGDYSQATFFALDNQH